MEIQNWIVVIVEQFGNFIENYKIVYIKWVNFMVCKLYLIL